MEETKGTSVLKVFAVLFAILAVSDLLKPFHLEGPTTGFVFLGTRTSGAANAILGPLFGIFLLVYAAGIWRMRRYVLGMAYAYAAYVFVNLIIYSVKHRGEPQPLAFTVVYIAGAIGISWGTAIMLHRRRAQLT
ncbi:MAG TPA: hypothetical protein VIX59_01075 [Candidatus Binataceae bacterium]